MPRACKWCNSKEHTQFYCRLKPKKPIKRTRPKKLGKHHLLWKETRDKWFEQNKAAYYWCYICGKQMTRTQLTLDHIKPRGSNPKLRYKLSNLAPCCWECNGRKGSMSLERYKEKYNVR